jgi:catechol 2,3-dioxygenase-like lactoylglutathione lyase family enzyme
VERVTGIGGVFFRARDPERLRDWYVQHLGLEPAPDFIGTIFRAGDGDVTVWSCSQPTRSISAGGSSS